MPLYNNLSPQAVTRCPSILLQCCQQYDCLTHLGSRYSIVDVITSLLLASMQTIQPLKPLSFQSSVCATNISTLSPLRFLIWIPKYQHNNNEITIESKRDGKNIFKILSSSFWSFVSNQNQAKVSVSKVVARSKTSRIVSTCISLTS